MYHRCIKKGEGLLSKERLKQVCGCEGMLVQCHLSGWINDIQKGLVRHLKTDYEWPTYKFWADTDPACPNANQLYPESQYWQTILRQYISVFLPFFALNPKPPLPPILHQRLQYLASTEHTRIRDSTEHLAQYAAEEPRLKAEEKARLKAEMRASLKAEKIAKV